MHFFERVNILIIVVGFINPAAEHARVQEMSVAEYQDFLYPVEKDTSYILDELGKRMVWVVNL
jgi:hypothetical protein